MVEMNFKTRMSVSLITVVSIFITGLLLGALLLTGFIHYSDQDSIPDSISAPSWEPGKHWTYSFKTPDIDDTVSRVVVASSDDTNYQVGVASRTDAQRHGVLNYNPMLGRITIEKLAVYERGIEQPLFDFPLKNNAKWTFSMFNIEDFSAQVKSIKSADIPGYGETNLVNIQATSVGGATLAYSYDTEAQWIRSLVLGSSSGDSLLEMTLVSYGTGFTGDVYFVRGVDLFDEEYSSPVLDIYNSFFDSGHPDWGEFNYLIYYYDITTNDASGGTLAVTDPGSEIAMRRVFGPNTFERTLGTIPSESGEWQVTVSLAGNSNLQMKIAGGLEYIWAVS